MSDLIRERTITLDYAPDIPGLTFRGFQGESDYLNMLAMIDGTKHADGEERADTLESISTDYAHLTNCDTETDMLFVEVDGAVVGYERVTWWQEEATGDWIYLTGIAFLLPEWRGKGIGSAMLRWAEERLREIRIEQGHMEPGKFESWGKDVYQEDRKVLLTDFAYQPVTYAADMVRPDLENIPDLPLPDGIEVRPVTPDHYRAIWEADKEAFRDHWGYSEAEYSEEGYQRWLADPIIFTPDLWQIAWDVEKNEVAGMVRNFINYEENEEYGRPRGYTEFISVRRPYRRQGLAKALIARSFQVLKDAGMDHAKLGVHTENPNGAFKLYESLGFEQTTMVTIYRKPLN